MTRLTAAQLDTVRSEDQYTLLHLVKYEPPIILQAQINDASIEKAATTITYDTVVTGSYLYVEAGMTLYIGTTPGGMQIGRVRVRSATATTLTVAPDSNIPYVDNLYLTVKDFHEFWPVFPYTILNSGTTPITYTLYKDRDITLNDENTNFDPVVIMGPNFAEFWDMATGTSFSATGSYTVDGSTISRYVWQFPTGSSSYIVTGTSPGFITFPGPGNYTVRCTAIASNGKSLASYRHVMFLNRYAGNPRPISDWMLNSLDGEWGIGWNAKVEVRARANEFKDGDLVFIIAEDYYNGVRQSFGGYQGKSNVVFCGYVFQIDNEYDAFDSKSMIYLKGLANYMQNKEMFSIQMTDVSGTPADWTQIQNLSINKALNHYFRWHTTLLNMADFIDLKTAHGAYRENIITIQKGEIFSTFNNFVKQRVFGAFMSDRQSRCWAEVDFNMIATGSRDSSVMTLVDQDWIDKPTFIERIELPSSNVLLGGEAYDPTNGVTGTALLSRAPGAMQTYSGKSESISGVTLQDQTQLNQLSGLYFARETTRYPSLKLNLSFNMRNIDIVPQEFHNFVIEAADTHRSLSLTPRLIPRKISYDLNSFTLKSNVEFDFETFGPPGDTIIIPVEVPQGDTDCEDDPDNCNPPCENGDCGDTDTGTTPGGELVYVATTTLVGRTRNFTADSPNWEDVRGGATFSGIQKFILDPFDPLNTGYILTSSSLYKSTDLNSASPTWTEMLTAANVQTTLGITGVAFYDVAASISGATSSFCAIWVVFTYDNGAVKGVRALRSTNRFTTWATAGVVVNPSAGDTDSMPICYAGQWDSNTCWVGVMNNNRACGIFKTTNGGSSWTQPMGGEAFDRGLSFHISYNDTENTGVFILQSNNYGDAYTGQNGSWSKTYEAGIPPSGPSFQYFPKYLMNIATANANNILVAMPRRAETLLKVLKSTDRGSTWSESSIAGAEWDSEGGSGGATALGRWPYDATRVFILSNSRILYSIDTLTTVLDKTGDWSTVFSAAFANGRTIVPVWIV